ncbi:MAG: hypothetical protein KY397_00635 [Gemmatimonadetes bacterium]|nr:hypothetical protein [Gemmatimonadota bacterium]
MTRSLIKPFRRAILALAVLGLVACEDQGFTPAAPEADPPTVTFNGVQLVTVRPEARGLFLADDEVEVDLVDVSEGATLTAEDAQLIVQPNSIPEATTIRMEVEDEDDILGFEFGPNGLVFDPAATLIISADKADLDDIDPTRLAIAGASDDVDDWQVIGGIYDPLTNSVTVPILHFSRYALCVR